MMIRIFSKLHYVRRELLYQSSNYNKSNGESGLSMAKLPRSTICRGEFFVLLQLG